MNPAQPTLRGWLLLQVPERVPGVWHVSLHCAGTRIQKKLGLTHMCVTGCCCRYLNEYLVFGTSPETVRVPALAPAQ
jgi:hypothetical protein